MYGGDGHRTDPEPTMLGEESSGTSLPGLMYEAAPRTFGWGSRVGVFAAAAPFSVASSATATGAAAAARSRVFASCGGVAGGPQRISAAVGAENMAAIWAAASGVDVMPSSHADPATTCSPTAAGESPSNAPSAAASSRRRGGVDGCGRASVRWRCRSRLCCARSSSAAAVADDKPLAAACRANVAASSAADPALALACASASRADSATASALLWAASASLVAAAAACLAAAATRTASASSTAARLTAASAALSAEGATATGGDASLDGVGEGAASGEDAGVSSLRSRAVPPMA